MSPLIHDLLLLARLVGFVACFVVGSIFSMGAMESHLAAWRRRGETLSPLGRLVVWLFAVALFGVAFFLVVGAG